MNTDYELLLRRHESPTKRGYIYDVLYGQEIIASSIDPEFAACRELAKRGILGYAVTRRKVGGTIGMRLNIAKCAELSTHEPAKGGLYIGKFSPYNAPNSE